MAEYDLAAGEHGAYAKTLTAGTIDTVTFEDDLRCVEVFSDGAAALYVTVDGSDPVVAAPHTWELPAGMIGVRQITITDVSGAMIIVKLTASADVLYSVSACGT